MTGAVVVPALAVVFLAILVVGRLFAVRAEDHTFGETVDVPSGITEAQRRRVIGARERERRRVESCCYAVGLYPYLADDCPWCGPKDAA